MNAYLAALDARYDPAARMPWCHATGPGYHTRVPEGSRAHQTREAADYALALLREGGEQRIARAHDVLGALVDQQVTDPLAEHYGLWGWFLEEPPGQMRPADWNWADFIGVRLAQTLVGHGELLRPDIAELVRTALHHAAMAIFRRNTDPGYTNIAVMGAVTCVAAGELLTRPWLVDYGRRRLAAVLSLYEQTGGFTEYNSPAYARVVLEELERAELIVADRASRDLAQQLRTLTWAALADRFHPGTGQLAGPMSRAYHDWIRPDLARYLAAQTGAPVAARPETEPVQPTPDLVPPLPCPPRIAARFAALPQSPVQLRTRFTAETSGTTWLSEDACLGSADEEFGWVQRRPMLGYWRTPADPAVVLRARMLLDGHDLSAAWCRQAQDGPRVLSAWWLSYDSGDFHPVLDRPNDSVFTFTDLRLAVTLRGNGVSAAALGEGLFSLTAGERQAVVHTVPALFCGDTVDWHTAATDGEARVEAVLHTGGERRIDFHTAVLDAGFAVELLPVATDPAGNPPQRVNEGRSIRWRWSDLTVDVPAEPTSFTESRP